MKPISEYKNNRIDNMKVLRVNYLKTRQIYSMSTIKYNKGTKLCYTLFNFIISLGYSKSLFTGFDYLGPIKNQARATSTIILKAKKQKENILFEYTPSLKRLRNLAEMQKLKNIGD